MDRLFHVVILLFLILPACTSMENSSTQSMENGTPFSMEPRTIAQTIEADSSAADAYSWIEESEYDDIWIIADEFPNMVKGMRNFHLRVLEAYLQTPSDACEPLEGERFIFQFVINEEGSIVNITSSPNEPTECVDYIQKAVASTEFRPGKVNGETVSTLFSAPVSL